MLKDLQEKEGLAVEYVYRTPWKALLEEKAMKKYALQLEIALLTMLLILSSSGAIEKGSSMDKLITVSVTGRKGVLTRKVTLSLLLATLVLFFISEKIGNRIVVLLIGTVLFLIPTLAFILV